MNRCSYMEDKYNLLTDLGWIIFIIGIFVLLYNTTFIYFKLNEVSGLSFLFFDINNSLNILALNRITGVIISLVGSLLIVGNKSK